MAKDKNKIIDPFDNVSNNEPILEEYVQKYGKSYLKKVEELQVGFVGKDSTLNPRVMRANFQGMWLGANKFGATIVDAFPSPASLPTNAAPFRVDMLGNIIATALFIDGRRSGSIGFYDENNDLSGSIFGLGDDLVLEGTQSGSSVFFRTGGVLAGGLFPGGSMVLVKTAASYFAPSDGAFVFNYGTPLQIFSDVANSVTLSPGAVFRLAPAASDPAGTADGSMYYNTTSSKARVKEGGVWRDI